MPVHFSNSVIQQQRDSAFSNSRLSIISVERFAWQHRYHDADNLRRLILAVSLQTPYLDRYCSYTGDSYLHAIAKSRISFKSIKHIIKDSLLLGFDPDYKNDAGLSAYEAAVIYNPKLAKFIDKHRRPRDEVLCIRDSRNAEVTALPAIASQAFRANSIFPLELLLDKLRKEHQDGHNAQVQLESSVDERRFGLDPDTQYQRMLDQALYSLVQQYNAMRPRGLFYFASRMRIDAFFREFAELLISAGANPHTQINYHTAIGICRAQKSKQHLANCAMMHGILPTSNHVEVDLSLSLESYRPDDLEGFLGLPLDQQEDSLTIGDDVPLLDRERTISNLAAVDIEKQIPTSSDVNAPLLGRGDKKRYSSMV